MTDVLNRDAVLCRQDILLLSRCFAEEIEDLIPVPATVDFWCTVDTTSWSKEKGSTRIWSDDEVVFLTETAATGLPARKNGQLFVPLKLEHNHPSILLVEGVDPDLLGKMSPLWLLELQGRIQKRLEHQKLIYVDPETGLYNSRALHYIVEEGDKLEKEAFFLLVHTASRRRSAIGNRQRMRQVAHFLEAVTGGALFFLGLGVFGMLDRSDSRARTLDFAHSLLKRLKREGVQRANIGLLRIDDVGKEDILNLLYRTLSVAEQRGSFSLCDSGSLLDPQYQPFALPKTSCLRALQKSWRGVEKFGLIVVRFEKDETEEKAVWEHIFGLLSGKERLFLVSKKMAYIFLPGLTRNGLYERFQEIGRDLGTLYHDGAPALGASFWPCQGWNKTDTVRNCRKTLMHGSFYGPGAMVFFDHLTLNVSGDYYFEEGDYRQAVREYRAGLRFESSDVNLMNSLGVALAEQNRHREAIAWFEKVLESDADNIMALVNLGLELQSLGRDEEALAIFEKAGEVQFHGGTENTDVYLQLGRLYCQFGRYHDAIHVLEILQKKKGEGAEFSLYRLLGEAYMESGAPAKAISVFQKALQLYPRNADSMSMLGLLYVEEGQGNEIGLSLCKKALSLDEGNGDLWYRLGRAQYRAGEFSEAFESITTCTQLQKNHVQAILLLGRLYQAFGNMRKARTMFRRVLSLSVRPDGRQEEARACLLDLEAENIP